MPPSRDLPGVGDDCGLQVALLSGAQCEDWLNADENRAAWAALHARCPWSTAFQSPTYFWVWTTHYRDWTPVLVLARRAGALVGLLGLAARNGIVTGVGAHQAEYHNWIYDREVASDFPKLALDQLRTTYPGSRIVLRYLSPGIPVEALLGLERDARIAIRRQPCPYMDLSVARIDETLKKKGNRSKLNRLKREGDCVFKEMSQDDLRRHIESVAAQCDFRQGAVNDSCPFTDDPQKKEFHLAWLAADPSAFHISGLFVNGALVSFVMLVHSRLTSHIGILAYAPAYAVHSTSKLHLYFAARDLAQRGRLEIDMTPGGDTWKERFGNRHEVALELVVYPTYAAAVRIALTRRLHRLLRAVLPQNWRDELRKTIAKSALALTASAQSRKKATAPLIFRLLPRAGGVAVAPQTLAVNPLAALVDWSSRHRRAQRQEILAAALARIEAGETCYARIDPEGDAYAVWLGSGDELFAMSNRPAEKCMVLRGFGGLELDVRSPVGRDLLRDVVLKLRASGVTTPIYLTLARVDRIVRTFVEELGFREVTISGDADAA